MICRPWRFYNVLKIFLRKFNFQRAIRVGQPKLKKRINFFFEKNEYGFSLKFRQYNLVIGDILSESIFDNILLKLTKIVKNVRPGIFDYDVDGATPFK